jgi:hypothetical protein
VTAVCLEGDRIVRITRAGEEERILSRAEDEERGNLVSQPLPTCVCRCHNEDERDQREDPANFIEPRTKTIAHRNHRTIVGYGTLEAGTIIAADGRTGKPRPIVSVDCHVGYVKHA